MSFIKRILTEPITLTDKKPPPAEDLSHAQLLILVFEEDEIDPSDITKFREVCKKEGWDYEQRVIKHMAERFGRRLAETDRADLDALKQIIDTYCDRMPYYELSLPASRKLSIESLTVCYNLLLKRMRKVSIDRLKPSEWDAILYAISQLGVPEVDCERFGLDTKLNTIAQQSLKSAIKYLQTMLVGDRPRYDLVLNHHRDLMSLARHYNRADKDAMLKQIFRFTEEMYDTIQAYLLMRDTNFEHAFQPRDKILLATIDNMNRIKYQGRWKQVYEHIRLNSDLIPT